MSLNAAINTQNWQKVLEVADVENMANYWDKVLWNDVSNHHEGPYESGLLKLNCDKALFDLEWRSTLKFKETVKMTLEWYKNYYQNKTQSMYDFTIGQINTYTKAAKKNNFTWTDND